MARRMRARPRARQQQRGRGCGPCGPRLRPRLRSAERHLCAAVPRPSPSRAAAPKRCAPHVRQCAPRVSDVFYAIIIMLKMESVCTFCWRAWCWSLDQDQTCCVLARLSCTGHPMKACDARTSPRPCDTSTIRRTRCLSLWESYRCSMLHSAELYHFWLAPRCVQRHKKQLGIS